MTNLIVETALTAMQLQQLLMEFAHELDFNSGLKVGELYTEDGTFILRDSVYRGRRAIIKFYKDYAARVIAEEKDGVRTQRHSFVNIRASVEDSNHATLHFISLNYSAGGKVPVPNLTGPRTLIDCYMKCRRGTDGRWRIAEFSNKRIFFNDVEIPGQCGARAS
jgi:hypothetical protein